MCFGYSKEPSHRDGSFEYPKHNKIIFSYTLLSGGLGKQISEPQSGVLLLNLINIKVCYKGTALY